MPGWWTKTTETQISDEEICSDTGEIVQYIMERWIGPNGAEEWRLGPRAEPQPECLTTQCATLQSSSRPHPGDFGSSQAPLTQ